MKSLSWIASIGLSLLASAACGSDSPDAGTDGGGSEGDSGAGGDGTVPAPIPQSGVAYVAHFLPNADTQNRLIWYRTDGTNPSEVGSLDLGAPTQDMVMDTRNNILAILSDSARTATLYRIARPASAGAAIDAPVKAGVVTMPTGEIPVSAVFNELLQRMYVIASTREVNENFKLYAYDVANPDSPAVISGFPVEIPPTVYQAIDSARELFFVGGLSDDKLHVYDLNDSGLRELPGGPLDLPTLFPEFPGQTSQTAFQVRHTTVDPWRNRVYATRSQSTLSELMAFEYPDTVPTGTARYGDFASTSDFTLIADGFDSQVASDDRPNLLDGYGIALDQESGDVFMLGAAWNGMRASAIALNLEGDSLSLQTGCNDFEGFGCYLRSYQGGTAGAYLGTDGALCYDSTHKTVVATSIAIAEDEPGQVHFFSVAADRSMTNLLSEEGATLPAGVVPVASVCH